MRARWAVEKSMWSLFSPVFNLRPRRFCGGDEGKLHQRDDVGSVTNSARRQHDPPPQSAGSVLSGDP